MRPTPLAPWLVPALAVGVAVGSGVWLLPAPVLGALLVGATGCFALALTFMKETPARWGARTLSGCQVRVDADAARVLRVAGEALQQAGVRRLEEWPGELIASRDSLGGSEHVEVRLRTVDGLVHVDVRRRTSAVEAEGPDVVEHLLAALRAL